LANRDKTLTRQMILGADLRIVSRIEREELERKNRKRQAPNRGGMWRGQLKERSFPVVLGVEES